MQIEEIRSRYHEALCARVLGYRDGVPSNADRHHRLSIALADGMAERMGGPFCESLPKGQSLGARFAAHTREFIQEAFQLLAPLRPGVWSIVTTQAAAGISAFEQYGHLAELSRLAREYRELRISLGADYLITPDIMVAISPVDDDRINASAPPDAPIISPDSAAAKLSPIRKSNQGAGKPILHASISCKWTMRSDRAQNTRTEALNLMRNRKGGTPRICVVTAEPLPSRLASIAIGTGDIDCTYHAALPELVSAAEMLAPDFGAEAYDELQVLIEGRRLRDISDLPFDLAI